MHSSGDDDEGISVHRNSLHSHPQSFRDKEWVHCSVTNSLLVVEEALPFCAAVALVSSHHLCSVHRRTFRQNENILQWVLDGSCMWSTPLFMRDFTYQYSLEERGGRWGHVPPPAARWPSTSWSRRPGRSATLKVLGLRSLQTLLMWYHWTPVKMWIKE